MRLYVFDKIEMCHIGKERVKAAKYRRSVLPLPLGESYIVCMDSGASCVAIPYEERDLIDELYVTIAPRLLGGRDAPTLLEGAGLDMAGQRRLKLVDVRVNCEQNSLLYRVIPTTGGVCHTKDADGDARRTCYYRALTSADVLEFV